MWGPLRSSPSASLPSPVLGVVAVSPSSSGACAVACVVALAVAGVVAWRLGCGGGLRGVLGGSPGGCSPFFPCGCTLLPLCGVRWSVGATRCGSCGIRSVLRRRVLAGVRLRGSRGVDLGWGGAGLSVVACPSCVCALVPVVAPSPPVPRPLAFPFPGPLVVSCPRVALPPVPCPCGRLPATLGLSSPLCRGPSLCPFPSRCGGGGVVAKWGTTPLNSPPLMQCWLFCAAKDLVQRRVFPSHPHRCAVGLSKALFEATGALNSTGHSTRHSESRKLLLPHLGWRVLHLGRVSIE